MYKILKIFLIALLNTTFLSMSAMADELKLTTDPIEANIYIRDFGGTVNNKVGKTPFTGNIQELAGSYSKSGFFMLVIEKDGYLTQSIVMSDLLKSDLSINVNLEPIQDFTKYKNVDRSINELFKAQRLIRAMQYDDALEKLKKLEDEEKNLSIVPEMIASTYYLKKEMKTALAWYKKAYRVNPENKDAFMMKAYLEKSIGTDNDKGK
jgi:tetratricopeptide (TPR) repeat protein